MQEIQIMLAIITVCVFYICVILTMIYADMTWAKHNTTKPTKEYKTPPKAKIKPTEQTDEQRQHNTLMSNIDNYNGTGAKQEKVR